MAVNLKIDMRKLGKFERSLGAKYETTLKRALKKAAVEILDAARQRALQQRIYDLGRFFSGLRAVARKDYSITVYNTAKHAVFVERGRRAGARMPPKRAILEWVLRHGMPASAWYPVARKIAERGIRPRKVVESQTFHRLAKQIMRDRVAEAMDEAMKRAKKR